MNVRLEHHWPSESYRIWFFERHPLRIYRPCGPALARWEDIATDTATDGIEPSLTLPITVLEALLREAETVIPATHATERHLADTIAVRDRLLALVEEGWS